MYVCDYKSCKKTDELAGGTTTVIMCQINVMTHLLDHFLY